jgi:hypothetical protein
MPHLQFCSHPFSGSRIAFVVRIMATKRITRPLVKQTLALSSSQHISRLAALRCPFYFFPTRRRFSQHSPARPAFIAGQRRAFSKTLRTRYATVEDSIDPRDQPRESDEVDVCIVGGGTSTESRVSRCSHSEYRQTQSRCLEPMG